MSNVHIVLQGKGGVGKSLAASMLAQYLTKRGESPLCIDTDPINATLAGFQSLNVSKVELLENGDINPRKFDAMMEMTKIDIGDDGNDRRFQGIGGH